MTKAAMTRQRVMAAFHGNVPSRISCQANKRTGSGPGRSCGDEATAAATHHSTTRMSNETVRLMPLGTSASGMGQRNRPEYAWWQLLQPVGGLRVAGAP